MVEEPKIAHKGAPIEFGELDESVNFAEWLPETKTDLADEDSTQARHCEAGDCETRQGEPGSCQASAAEFENDIEVETSTANWVEEPAESTSPAPTAVSPTALFGEFEQEEEVAVGSGFARPPSPAILPTEDLEVMLHQEIVNITTFDETAAVVNETSMFSNDQSDASGTHEFLAEPEAQDQESITIDDEDTGCQISEDQEPVIRLSQAESEESDPVAATHDDSDILVIEDEIELRMLVPASRVDSQEKTISVDFQEMLSRMQCGS